MNYQEWKNDAYKLLTKYMTVNEYQFIELERERVERKKYLNEILGLNEENNYRILLNNSITETQFKKDYPFTIKFIEHVIGNNVDYKITTNRIKTGEKTWKKLSKVLSNFFNELGISEELSDYNNIAHELYHYTARELNVNGGYDNYVSCLMDTIKPKNLVISTNIYDMLTSSTNATFTSCYNMDGGEYFNGNLSYIRDNFTIIMFAYTEDIGRKIGRSWGYIFPHEFKMMMPKSYGSLYRLDCKKIRKYIQTAISKYKGIKPYWKMIHNIDFTGDNYDNGRGPVYVDTAGMGMAYHKHQTDNLIKYLEFEPARCLQCGKDTYNGENGACSSCDENGDNYCECCGNDFNGEVYHDDNGNTICEYCYDEYYRECDCCSYTCDRDYMYYVEGDGVYVCKNCFEKHYGECIHCGENFHNNLLNSTSDGEVCTHCLHDQYSECFECGEYVKDIISYNDVYVCEHCKEKLDKLDIEVKVDTLVTITG